MGQFLPEERFIKKWRHRAEHREDLPKWGPCGWDGYTELKEEEPFPLSVTSSVPWPSALCNGLRVLGTLRAQQAPAARRFGSIDLLCLLLFPLPFKFPINALFSPEHLFRPREVGISLCGQKMLTPHRWSVAGEGLRAANIPSCLLMLPVE